MRIISILLAVLPLAALADLADPIDTIPGIGKPFSPVFLLSACLVVGGIILIGHYSRRFAVRFLLLLVLLVCVAMFYVVSDVKCVACNGFGCVRGGAIFAYGRCPCCNGSGQHLRWVLKRCLTFSELKDRLSFKYKAQSEREAVQMQQMIPHAE